jgi:hypothetical protein
MVELRIAPTFGRAAEIMGEGLDDRSRTLLSVALDFACWRNLRRSLSSPEAAVLMSDVIGAVAEKG